LKKEEFYRELVREMGSLRILGCTLPVGMGGSDLGFLALSIACEQVSTFD
jgi:alkylation response protein AidB-like acyl-CoA dehydrogenase